VAWEIIKVINGCIPVLITPFNDDGSIDFSAYDKLIDGYLSGGVSSLWILGTGAEDMAIPLRERVAIVRYLAENFGSSIDLLVGCSFYALQETFAFLEFISGSHIHSLHYMPYQPLIGLDQLEQNYLDIAAKATLPIWLYTSGNWARHIPPTFLERFASNERFAGCKYSTSNIVEMERAMSFQHSAFQVLPAVVKQLLPSLSLGAKAFTTVEASIHLTRIMSVYEAFVRGDLVTALQNQKALNRLLEGLSCGASAQNFLKTAEIKAILEKQGICSKWVAKGLRDVTDEEAARLYETYCSA
jgi:dihydrodipicolinate synthase/N-acetylneuraminate lyase